MACAEAGAFLISPFVGRILDWYKKAQPDMAEKMDKESEAHDPGVASVTKIYKYYRTHGYKTIVMGASFRNSGEILALAGCDKLTIGPKFLQEFKDKIPPATVAKKLYPTIPVEAELKTKVEMSEKNFRWMMNQDAMATEKLAEGLRGFDKDFLKLKDIIVSKLLA